MGSNAAAASAAEPRKGSRSRLPLPGSCTAGKVRSSHSSAQDHIVSMLGFIFL